MAFYKYGFAFLAGTGFGAALTSLRRDHCPLHRRHCCHRRRYDHDHHTADEMDYKEAAGEEFYMKERKRGTTMKAKKAAVAAREEDDDDDE
uniref:Defense-responsive protein n=1 Tax=Leersia perrieri TaxID=77586 RepID=A0A0D9X4K1_9ORYZ